MQSEIDKLRNTITDLQTKLDEKLKYQKTLEANPNYLIAEELHKAICHLSHIDGCDWFYDTWPPARLNGVRHEYLHKAAELMHVLGHDKERAFLVIRAITSY